MSSSPPPQATTFKSSTSKTMMNIGKIAWVASFGGALYLAKKLHNHIVDKSDISTYRATHFPHHHALHGQSSTFRHFQSMSNISPHWEEEFDTRMEKVCAWSAQLHALHLADIETFRLFQTLFTTAQASATMSTSGTNTTGSNCSGGGSSGGGAGAGNVLDKLTTTTTTGHGQNNYKDDPSLENAHNARMVVHQACGQQLILLTKRLFFAASICESMMNEFHHLVHQLMHFNTIAQWFGNYMDEYGNIYKRVFDRSRYRREKKANAEAKTPNDNTDEHPWIHDTDTLRLDLEDYFKRLAFCNALKYGTTDVTNRDGAHLCLMHVRYWTLMHTMQVPGMRRVASSLENILCQTMPDTSNDGANNSPGPSSSSPSTSTSSSTSASPSWTALSNAVAADISTHTHGLVESQRRYHYTNQQHQQQNNRHSDFTTPDERRAFLSQGVAHTDKVPNITSAPMQLLTYFQKDTTVFGLLPMISGNMFSYLGPAPNEPCFLIADKLTPNTVTECTLRILMRVRFLLQQSTSMARYTSLLHTQMCAHLPTLASQFDHDTQHTIGLAKIKITTLSAEVAKLTVTAQSKTRAGTAATPKATRTTRPR